MPGPRQPRSVTYAGFGLAVALLAFAGILSWRSQQLYQGSVAWTNHSYDVLDEASQLLITIQRAEGSARGYAVSGMPSLLEDAQTSAHSVRRRMNALDSLIRDNDEQVATFEAMRPLLNERLALTDSLLVSRRREPWSTAELAAIVRKGTAIGFPLRNQMSKLIANERRILGDREELAANQGRLALFAVSGALVLALIIIAASTAVTLQELAERTRAEHALQLEAERQAVIIEMQQAIAMARPEESGVLDLLLDQAMQLTEAGGAALSFVEGDRHRPTRARGDLIPWIGGTYPLKDSLFGEVIRSMEPENIADVMTDPRTDRESADALGTHACVLLPILSGESAIGALVLSSKRVGAFSAQDVASLKILSGILSAGITNAAAAQANERLMDELRRSRDAAEEANRAKSAFLATMSHELRTPLNSVIGFANILLRNKEQRFGEKDLQFLTRIKDNGTQLLHLINDVLDVSKIEAGRMEVRPVPTDLTTLIEETIAQLEPQARERGVELRARIPGGLTPVDVDPARFRQVLINLVGNALKFTEQGSVTVTVYTDPLRHPTRIEVADTGVGIPPDRLAAIFEAFTQAESTTERRFGGTGLGLTISRALLHLMGAGLEVRSAVGKGSTFTITLPVAGGPAVGRAAPHDAAPLAIPAAPVDGLAPLILVIDDEADSRALLRTYLEEDGYRTEEAADGAEGLMRARDLRPALITLDLRMPRLSGIEVLRQLRIDPELADIPVVVVSIEAAEHRGALIGAVDALAKPVERDALLAVVQRARPSGRRRVLIVDDDPHTRQLFAAFLGAEGYQVRSASDGLTALNALQQEIPDLVLLDLRMPVMDGGTFLAALRTDPRLKDLPVAVITALDADSESVRRLDGVAQAVIQKGPALEKSLHALIDRLVGPAARG